jgi:hypothetical protein
LDSYSSNALFLSLIVSGLPAADRFSLVGLCNAAALLTGPFGVILLLLLAATLLGRILSLLRVLTLSHNHCETSTGCSLRSWLGSFGELQVATEVEKREGLLRSRRRAGYC